MLIHLGVFDIPYKNPVKKPRPAAKPRKGVRKGGRFRKSDFIGGGKTIGDVAEILEAKYHVAESFFNLHVPEFQESMEAAMKGSLETVLQNGPVPADPFQAAYADIVKTFQSFIDNKGFDGLIAGVPTAASLKGINHRLAHPYAKSNPARPSFLDTGQYQEAFTVWVDP